MRHGESDAAAFAAVDQPLLHQRVAGRGEGLGLALGRAARRPTVGTESVTSNFSPPSGSVCGGVGHRPQVFALGRRGPLEPGAEEADRQLGLGFRGGDRDVLRR